MSRSIRTAIMFQFFLWIALPFNSVSAQQQSTPSPDDINRVAEGLYCPICDNTPLDVCENTVCSQWRAEISRLLNLGWEDDAIRDFFADQYGPGVLAVPPASGWTLWVYIIPPVLFLAGLGIILRLMKRTTTAAETPRQEQTPQSDPYLEQVEAELARRERRVKP
jgi:cytochrome c-type biogenesis protein CcmH